MNSKMPLAERIPAPPLRLLLLEPVVVGGVVYPPGPHLVSWDGIPAETAAAQSRLLRDPAAQRRVLGRVVAVLIADQPDEISSDTLTIDDTEEPAA